jgi:cardiolipin synthase
MMPGRSWRRHAAVLILAAGGLLSGAGCQLPRRSSSQGDALAACEPRQIIARRTANALALHFHVPGKNFAAVAEWKPLPDKIKPAVRLQLSEHPQVEGIWRQGRRVAVAGPDFWRQMVGNAAARMAPPAGAGAALLPVQGQDAVVFRERDGRVRLLPVDRMPGGLAISRTISERSLTQLLCAEASARLQKQRPRADSLLVITGEQPPLVLLAPGLTEMVFVYPPVDPPGGVPMLGLEKLPPDFTLRTLLALGWHSSLFSALNNPVTFLSRGASSLVSFTETLLHMRSGSRNPAGAPPATATPSQAPMDLKLWDRDLDFLTSSPSTYAQIEFQIDGEEFFPPFIQAVQSAARSIDLQFYIFDTDPYAVKIADLLREKSRTARVRIMTDQLGALFAGISPPISPAPAGFTPPNDITSYLERGSKVKVRPLSNPWLTSTHTKSIVIDGEIGWLGGMNIGQEYRTDWHDLMIQVKGPLLGIMQKEFTEAWQLAGPGGDFALAWSKLFAAKSDQDDSPSAPPPGAIRVRPLYTRTWDHEIERVQIQAMRRAQRRIWLENAYFTDDRMLSEVLAARSRGVDVRVILPEENDMGFIGASNLVTIGELLRHGVRVFAYPGMSHVKAALYDGWACVGSANFDRLSLRVNHEFSIGFSNPATIAKLERQLFLNDFRASKEITQAPPVNWMAQFLELLANQL